MPKKQTLYQKKYDKANSKFISLKLNLKYDADILEKLDSVESKQGYIKQLIREDIKKKNENMY